MTGDGGIESSLMKLFCYDTMGGRLLTRYAVEGMRSRIPVAPRRAISGLEICTSLAEM